MLDCLRDSLAPGAVWVRGQTQALRVSRACGVAQAETGESSIQAAGLWPRPGLWGRIRCVLAQRCGDQSSVEGGAPDGMTFVGDHALASGERERKGLMLTSDKPILADAKQDVLQIRSGKNIFNCGMHVQIDRQNDIGWGL